MYTFVDDPDGVVIVIDFLYVVFSSKIVKRCLIVLTHQFIPWVAAGFRIAFQSKLIAYVLNISVGRRGTLMSILSTTSFMD